LSAHSLRCAVRQWRIYVKLVACARCVSRVAVCGRAIDRNQGSFLHIIFMICSNHVNPFAPRLPFSARRYRGLVAPYFANGAGSANMPIQYQLPEICVGF
jgi:hypothetical protein